MIQLYFIDSTGNLILEPTENEYFRSVISFLEEFRNSDAIIVQTSGSTGKPKKIPLTKSQVIASVSQTKTAFNLTPDDIAICSLPISYIAGKLMLLRAEVLGMRAIIIEPSSNPLHNLSSLTKSFFEENSGKLFYAFVPLQLENILGNQNDIKLLSYAKVVLSGGAALSISLATKLSNLQLNVYETYGMTETVTHVAIRKVSNENIPLPFSFLEGIEHGLNQGNCLKLKGLITNNQWIQTNDIIEYTSQNAFRLLGRLDNVINSGAVKLHPEQIEQKISILFADKNISNAFFCYGKADTQLGQKLVLFVEGVVSIDLKSLLTNELTKFELPKEIIYVEQLVRTSSNKINREKTAQSIL
jgi:O-succinylbenzoic acid--CoA ligase